MNITSIFRSIMGRTLPTLLLTASILCLSAAFQTAHAQQPQLSLADFLIGLRSKKVTLPERNKLLTEAAKARGVTFAMTPEIEKELENTGADTGLISAIREKATIVKIAATIPPKTDPVPASTPPPPDHAFYQKRAGMFFAKGDFDSAVTDLTKAIEMTPTDASDYANRGLALYNKKSYEPAVADFNKAIELKPADSMNYVNRGFAFEKMGSAEKALADFQKAVDVESSNETAKLNLKRLQDEKTKADAREQERIAALKPISPPADQTSTVIPESIDLGQIAASSAIRMVTPVYSEVAQKSGIEGKVVVNITLDVDGNVTSAKAVSGHPFLRQTCEDAARRSKFKPPMFGTHPVKATATIVYNFSKSTR